MTNKEKDLLLQDLCSRLPYKVKCSFYGGKYVGTIVNIFDPTTDEFGGIYPLITVYDDTYHKVNLSDFKPFLRPMSYMTEEEDMRRCAFLDDIEGGVSTAIPNYIDWLNEHRFDYRGLIEKGLALEAPEGMYNS